MKHEILVPAALVALYAVVSGSPLDDGLERLSVSSAGAQADAGAMNPVVTPDGRYVAFDSLATNLVPGDTNGQRDVFVHDRATGITSRVSVASDGEQANGLSNDCSISADGRYVAFQSSATNLVDDDTNSASDVFRHDRVTGVTIRLSVAGHDIQSDGFSYDPSISADGRYVAFTSAATNLVVGGTSNVHVYVRDTDSSVTRLASISPGGEVGNGDSYTVVITPDGRMVAFATTATNFFGRDYNGDIADIVVRDMETGVMDRVTGYLGNQVTSDCIIPSISEDGNRVAFTTDATNMVAGTSVGRHVFVHDFASGVNHLISQATSGVYGNASSYAPDISPDGNRVAFHSSASNLAPGDVGPFSDVFVRDIAAGTTIRVSRNSEGQVGNESSSLSMLTGDGRHVVFQTRATNLVPDDQNGPFLDIVLADARPEAAVGARNAGTNPASYTAGAPILGQPWTASVDLTTTGHSFAAVLGTTASANVTLNGGQRLLVGGQKLFQLALQPGPTATWNGAIPNNAHLAGLTIRTQAAHLLGVAPFALTNAQDLCIGH